MNVSRTWSLVVLCLMECTVGVAAVLAALRGPRGLVAPACARCPLPIASPFLSHALRRTPVARAPCPNRPWGCPHASPHVHVRICAQLLRKPKRWSAATLVILNKVRVVSAGVRTAVQL